MNVLVDTHMAIWLLTNSKKLPRDGIDIVSNPQNEIIISAISSWEVAIKHAAHPDNMTVTGSRFREMCSLAGYRELPLRGTHIDALETLAQRPESTHHDPFDRILIAQAKAEGMRFLTHDRMARDYLEPCILLV